MDLFLAETWMPTVRPDAPRATLSVACRAAGRLTPDASIMRHPGRGRSRARSVLEVVFDGRRRVVAAALLEMEGFAEQPHRAVAA